MVAPISLVFALLGLGFLIIIHELGHYWMARRCGMRVESFGIGFGRPILSVMHRGVRWNLCWIPFGGYVKIAGMETPKGGPDPHEIKDGFFGKTPFERILVSFAGPAANIIFAFLVFSLIWFVGGREKPFSDMTTKLGWVDPRSELFQNGVRPGDEILSYDDEPLRGSKSHIQAAMTGGEVVHVQGRHFDPKKALYTLFKIDIHPYPHPYRAESGLLTTGVLASANYLIWGAPGEAIELPSGAPMEHSGIRPGDRLVSLDGERLYSLDQLQILLNESRALVTIRRGKELAIRRIPRIHIEELKLTSPIREELADWQWEAGLHATKLSGLIFIPYNLNAEGVSKGPYFIPRSRARKAALCCCSPLRKGASTTSWSMKLSPSMVNQFTRLIVSLRNCSRKKCSLSFKIIHHFLNALNGLLPMLLLTDPFLSQIWNAFKTP